MYELAVTLGINDSDMAHVAGLFYTRPSGDLILSAEDFALRPAITLP